MNYNLYKKKFICKIACLKMLNKKIKFIEKLIILISDVLEYHLNGDKRFLKLSETQLALQVEIPDNYLFDNDAISKMIENVEITISHETVSRKSTAYDYALSNFFFNKLAFDDSYCSASMDTNGIWDPL